MSDSIPPIGNESVIRASVGPLFEEQIGEPHYTFQSFGSGSSGNCSILTYNGISLLLDLGIGARLFSKSLKEQCIDTSGLKAILVTHDHADHIRGIASFASRHGLPIYATEKVAHTFLYNRYIRQDLSGQVRRINVCEPFVLGGMTVEPFPVPHDASDNVGYTISSEAGVFSIITDIGHITEEIESAIRRSNYLVFESNYDEDMLMNGGYPMHLKHRITGGLGHISNRTSAETIVRLLHPHLRFVALCHLSGENNTPELAMSTLTNTLTQSGVKDIDALRICTLKRGEISSKFILSQR